MKQTIELSGGWQVKQLEPTGISGGKSLEPLKLDADARWFYADMPAQVHEILLREGLIDNPRVVDNIEKCKWVAEKDWVYKKCFDAKPGQGKAYLNFRGLDTQVDVYLNGEHLAYHDDYYLPLKIDVTGKLGEKNCLVLHFHSVYEYLKGCTVPAEWDGKIEKFRLVRKHLHDFFDYLGAKPYFTTVGVYDVVELEFTDEVELGETDVRVALDGDFGRGTVTLKVEGEKKKGRADLRAEISDPDGGVVCAASLALDEGGGAFGKSFELSLEKPRLWWPRGFGAQPLYKVSVAAEMSGEVKDRIEKTIGFREVKMAKPFDFEVNGRHIRLWGGNFTPVDGMTKCWNGGRVASILDLAENCNMNLLRVWGEGERYRDELYAEADRRGIFLWQEFFHGCAMQPNTLKFREACRAEASFQIKRLKHHPSVLLWCGGNEGFLCRDFNFPGEDYIGKEIFEEDYRQLCGELDPDRPYRVNSPYGGAYANDPSEGDTHSYTNTWYVPGADYPVFVSENLRVAPPAVKSLRRFMSAEKLWPKGYSGTVSYDEPYAWPSTWSRYTSAEGYRKIPPIENFYESSDLESTVYKYGAAYGSYLKETVERYRRGRPSQSADDELICKGHIVWKLNSTWPHIYSGVVDYYLEPYIPYYELKRAYEPVLISFDVGNHIYAWVVNDSSDDVEGTLVVRLFNPRRNIFVSELRREVRVPSGRSRVVTDLDDFGEFQRENVLFAYLIDGKGRRIARNNAYVDIERHLRFPDAKLSLSLRGDVLTVTTDRFARCVELSGEENGDEFGWLFEDNYFDLIPGEIKAVRVLKRHDGGMITAKAHYSDKISTLGL